MSNDEEMTKQETLVVPAAQMCVLGSWNFEFRACFGFWVSGFGFPLSLVILHSSFRS
jgi:hypothetical protein